MSVEDVWDLVVLGGGTAGIVAAKTASGLGARVLLVERNKTGGDCLWTGCVPSKSILSVAHRAALSTTNADMGITVSTVKIDFPKVMQYLKGVINEIAPQDSVEALTDAGITVIQGQAAFTSPTSITIDGVEHYYSRAIIATGAGPAIPAIPGMSEANFLTSENIWELENLPERLLILGAGSIGCELGQAFKRLGSEVTLIDGAVRILPREDESSSWILAEQLISEGVKIFTSAKVRSIETNFLGEGSIQLDLLDRTGEKISFNRILIAVGRSPRTTGIGLEKAGVELTKQGFVITCDSLRTTNRHIWAAGDITGHPQFTHVAGVHGSTAASNAILGLSRKAEIRVIPRVTFTDPEVAAVGVASNTNDSNLRVLERRNDDVDRAIAESKVNGVTKIVIDSKGKIVGGLIVGPRAGEALAEITLAIRMGLTTRDLASTIHPYPTYGDGLWNIAIADVRNQLMTPRVKFILHILRSFSRIRNHKLYKQTNDRGK